MEVYSRRRVGPLHREGDHWSVEGCRAHCLVDASGRDGLRFEGNADRDTDDVLLAIALSTSYPHKNGWDLRKCVEATPSGW